MVGKHVAGSVNIKSKNKDKHKTTPEVFDDSLSSVAPLLEPEPADVLGHLLHSRMPTNPEMQHILQERARLLARRIADKAKIAREPFVCVRLGPTERYGIAYKYLEHITYLTDISRIPCTPPAVAGVINYRGELLTILDLKKFFRTEVDGQAHKKGVVVVRLGRMRVGFLIDEIEGSDAYVVSELELPMHTGGVSNLDYVQGIHQGNITILNIEAILQDPMLRVEDIVN